MTQTLAEGETFAQLIEQLPPAQLDQLMAAEKYGSWYDNLQGIQEHSYYHLGQVVVIRKLVRGE